MSDIVNLRRARKQKARAEEAAAAATNRAAFGRTKTEKVLSKREAEIAKRKLNGHKRGDNE